MNDDEMQELEIENDQVVKYGGYVDYSHFEIAKYNTSQGLIRFGGSFAKALGELLIYADRNNGLKIMRYWHQECQQHEILYKMWLAKQQAYSVEL